MRRNLGIADRLIRIVLGVLVLGLYGALNQPWRYLTLLGLIPLGTALTGNCPLYTVLGVSSLRKAAGHQTAQGGPRRILKRRAG